MKRSNAIRRNPVANPIAKALRAGINRPQIVRPKKGRGAYTRKGIKLNA